MRSEPNTVLYAITACALKPEVYCGSRMMKKFTAILACLYLYPQLPAMAGFAYWRGDPPAVRLMEAVEMAQASVNEELGAGRNGEYQWCRAIIMGKDLADRIHVHKILATHKCGFCMNTIIDVETGTTEWPANGSVGNR